MGRGLQRWVVVAVGCALPVALHGLCGAAFDASALGHDYAYFLPSLLNGHYWQVQNGALALPWFTPAFCGGVPYLPNPQVMYHSVPQALTSVLGPARAAYVTFLTFAVVGYAGTYLLARRLGPASVTAAVLAGVIFALNGFYAQRLLAGYLSFHAFMLTPWVALWVARAGERGLHAAHRLGNLVLAALAVAYMVHGGMLGLVVPAVLAVVAVWLGLEATGRRQPGFAWRLGASSSSAPTSTAAAAPRSRCTATTC